MTTLTLKVEDSALEKVMWFLGHLKDVVKVEIPSEDEIDLSNDPLAQELQKRIQEIDDGIEVPTPYQEDMDFMMKKIRLKHANT